MFISMQVIARDIEDFEKQFKAQEYESLVKQFKAIGEQDLTEEEYRIFVYALSRIDLDDAEDAANRAISKYDQDPDMFLMHASIMGGKAQDSIFSALGYAEKALISLNKAVELAPQSPKYLTALMTFYIAAPSIAGGDMDKALEIANTINSIDPIEGAKSLARYYQSNDETKKAVQVLSQAISSHPNDVGLYSQLAFIYTSEDKFTEAIANFEQATAVNVYALTVEEQSDKALINARESIIYGILNSHYQIGRVSLLSESDIAKGITHLQSYIEKYQTTSIDTAGLPSVSWAKLRLAGLNLLNKQPDISNQLLKEVKLEDDSNMKKIYKTLTRDVKKALK